MIRVTTNRQRRIPKRTAVQYRTLLADALQHYYVTDTMLPVTNLPVSTLFPPEHSLSDFLAIVKRTSSDGDSIRITPDLGQILWDALITTLPWKTQLWHRHHDLIVKRAHDLNSLVLDTHIHYAIAYHDNIAYHNNGNIEAWSTQPWAQDVNQSTPQQSFHPTIITLEGQITSFFEPNPKRARTCSPVLNMLSSAEDWHHENHRQW